MKIQLLSSQTLQLLILLPTTSVVHGVIGSGRWVDSTPIVDGDSNDYYEEPLCISDSKVFTSRVNLFGGELGMSCPLS